MVFQDINVIMFIGGMHYNRVSRKIRIDIIFLNSHMSFQLIFIPALKDDMNTHFFDYVLQSGSYPLEAPCWILYLVHINEYC